MPPWSRRAISSAVTSLPTLATTIGESDVAAAPSIVVPEARCRTVRPSRRTVRLAAGLLRASSSKMRSVAGRAGTGTVLVVVVLVDGATVLVVVLLVVVLLVVVLLVLVDGASVVVVAGGTEVELARETGAVSAAGASAEDAAPEHPARTRAETAIAECR